MQGVCQAPRPFAIEHHGVKFFFGMRQTGFRPLADKAWKALEKVGEGPQQIGQFGHVGDE